MSFGSNNYSAPALAAAMHPPVFIVTDIGELIEIPLLGTDLLAQTYTQSNPFNAPTVQTISITPTPSTDGTDHTAYQETVRDCLFQKSYKCFIEKVEAALYVDGSVNVGDLKNLKAALQLESVEASQGEYSKAHADMSIIINDLLLISENPYGYARKKLLEIGARTEESLLQLAEECTRDVGGASTLTGELRGVYEAQAKLLVGRF